MKIIKRLNNEDGLTLIELVTVIVLVTTLAGVLAKVVYYEVNTYEKVVDRKQQLQDSRYAFRQIARDIRHIVSKDSIHKATSDSLHCILIGSENTSYSYANERIYRNNDLMAEDIVEFKFTYLDGSGKLLSSPVKDPREIRSIALAMSRKVSGRKVTQRIKVTPRNF